jgi:cation:H+ antiporter
VLGLILGLIILFISSEIAVDNLIKIATFLGASMFAVGFIFSSIGSDLPEIFNSLFSAYLGHGDISVGDSFGSVNTQITLVLGLIPFFCRFCRLIPQRFAIVGISEVVILIISVFLAADGNVTRLDGLFLILLWGISILIIRKFGAEQIAVEKSDEILVPKQNVKRIILFIVLGFVGISVGSFLVVDSIIEISTALGVSEYLISFFFLALGTSMPELIVSISAIRRRHFELAIGDIIGSCIVDATLAVGLGPLFFPISIDGNAVILTGIYAIFSSVIVVAVLSHRGVNDKKTGALFLLTYLGTWLVPLFL